MKPIPFLLMTTVLVISGCDSGSSRSTVTLATLFPAPRYDGGPITTRDVILADMNNDGLDDVITSHSAGVSVSLAGSDGTLALPLTRALSNSIAAIAVTDFNGDGVMDVAAGDQSSNVFLCLGNGDGTLADPTLTPAVNGFVMVVADMNVDGFQDIVTGFFVDAPTLTRGQGNGLFFSPSTEYLDVGIFDLAIGDFNADNAPDLVAILNAEPNVAAIINNGSGGVAADYRFDLGAGSLTVGDFNADGASDFAVHNGNGVTTVLSRGDGTFDAPTVSAMGSDNATLTTLAFDADMNDDLIVNSTGDNAFNLLISNGKGGYQPKQRLLRSDDAEELITGNINGDELPDVVARYSNGISVFLGAPNGELAGVRSFDFDDNGDRSLTIGDFNNDDLPDAFVGYTNGNVFFEGTADSVFKDASVLSITRTLHSTTSLDFDQDGNLDLAGALIDLAGIALLRGNGEGGFEEIADLPTGDTPVEIVTADINGDGIDDLITANAFDDSVSVHLGEGNSLFLPEIKFPTGLTPLDLVSGQFNGDTGADLAVVNQNSGTISVFFGGTSPVLSAAPPIPTEGDPMTLACEDFNNDGADDLAIQVSIPGSGQIIVMLNDGTGAFTESAIFTAGVGQGLIGSDITKDGLVDLILTPYGPSDNDVAIFEGLGDGTFAEPKRFTTGLSPSRVAAIDLNGDKVKDICTLSGSSLEVLLSNLN